MPEGRPLANMGEAFLADGFAERAKMPNQICAVI